jgi:hypothetical protein
LVEGGKIGNIKCWIIKFETPRRSRFLNDSVCLSFWSTVHLFFLVIRSKVIINIRTLEKRSEINCLTAVSIYYLWWNKYLCKVEQWLL